MADSMLYLPHFELAVTYSQSAQYCTQWSQSWHQLRDGTSTVQSTIKVNSEDLPVADNIIHTVIFNMYCSIKFETQAPVT
jgi:hypothetical protein